MSPISVCMLFSVRAAMWCGGGMRREELVDRAAWRMSVADEVRRGERGIFFFFFFFRLDFQLFCCSPKRSNWCVWKRSSIRKLDFKFSYNTDGERDSYRFHIFKGNLRCRESLDKHKPRASLLIWAMSDCYWLTLLAFMSLPGSQIRSDSNCNSHGMKCQYEVLHNLGAWSAVWPSIYCRYIMVWIFASVWESAHTVTPAVKCDLSVMKHKLEVCPSTFGNTSPAELVGWTNTD